MKIYTLTGPSGTGKSYRAMAICESMGIESIVDDGLFIYKNRVEAGISAKRQASKVGAIKTALFTDAEHRADAKSRIEKLAPESILILATSDRMADVIIERLALPAPAKRIYIEDITTEEERDQAHRARNLQGQHIIPAPAPQLKRAFAGYFLDPMKFFKGRQLKQPEERTVVRPAYSYMGDFIISDKVIKDIVDCVASEIGSAKVLKVYENTSPDALKIDIKLALHKGDDVWRKSSEFQDKVTEEVENMTAFNIVQVDCEVRQII